MGLFHIITDHGATFVGSTEQVFLKHGDGYNAIGARYSSVDEIVLYERQWISKSLSQIDAALEVRSDRYRNAKAVLFERSNGGLYVPRLRTMIIRGIEVASNDLEDKILRNNGADFTPEEYRIMADIAYGIIASYASRNQIKHPAWETVLSWIKGKVIAPAEKRFFEGLVSVNPYFAAVYRSFQEGNGFKEAYEYFIGKRIGLTAYFANIRSAEDLEELRQTWSQRRKGSLAPELEFLLEEFGSDIQSRFVDASIRAIEEVRKKNVIGVKQRMKHELHLSKGVYTGMAPPECIKVVTIDQIDLSRMAGINPLQNPDLYIQSLKELCAEYGFPVQMMRDYLLRPADKGAVSRDVNNFLEERGLTLPALTNTVRGWVEEITGIKYEELSPEMKVFVDGLVSEQVKKIIGNLLPSIDDIHKQIANLIQRIQRM
ncbi:hypothetical protein HYX00_02965 [Candidatus Woesearchaeota archaeon]|nr:hypothetical protein [Candidatus Woesearchaeota archaeon]